MQIFLDMPHLTEVLQVSAAFFGFWMVVGNWIGYDYTPSSEHLYSWTAFWVGCCCVCTHFHYPWPFVGGTIAWTGMIKNLGMLWSSYPHQGIRPGMEVWPTWIAGLVLTALAAGIAFYRTSDARWTRNLAPKPISLDEEAA